MFKVSVVIPVKYPAKYLEKCLKVLSDQTFPPHEVLLVESSVDGPTKTLRSNVLFIRRIRQIGTGLPQAWNQGVAESNGTHIAFLDSDDEWDVHCLEKHSLASKDARYQGASVGRVIFEPSSEMAPGFRKNLFGSSHLAYMPGCSVFSKSALDKIGAFNENLGVASDIEWFARARQMLDFIEIDSPVLHKRVHDGNLSLNSFQTAVYERDLIQAIRQHIKDRKD